MVTYSASIISLDHLETVLTQKMVTEITDDTKITELRAGKLQEDPTKELGLNILIIPPNESWPIEIYTSQNGLISPTYEVGGGVYFINPYGLRFVLHFKGENNRKIARDKAHVIFARAKQTLLKMSMPTHPTTNLTQDDFDETIIELQVDKGFINEGGGPGHFIWRGWLYFRFLTEQANRHYAFD